MIRGARRLTISGILAALQRRGRQCAGVTESGNEIDLVVDDQFLREALGLSGTAPSSFEDRTSIFLAGDGVALLLHVELDRMSILLAGRGLAAVIGRISRSSRFPAPEPPRATTPASATPAAAARDQRFGANEHERSPPDWFSQLEPSPRPLPHHSPIFQPCISPHGVSCRATMSISTKDAIARPAVAVHGHTSGRAGRRRVG